MGNTLFQHSTIGALMAGMFTGTLSVKDLLAQGSMGIETLHGLDGELVIIDGTVYQVTVAGAVEEVDRNEKTPYAAVADFEKEDKLKIEKLHTGEQLQEKLKAQFKSINTFQALKMTGTFKGMHCRSVEKQEASYPRLAEVVEDQAEFTCAEVTGTLVGFYTPTIFGSIAVPEFHLHFLSDARDFGGHVLDFSLAKGEASWQTMETLEQHFPVENQSFMKSEIDYSNLTKNIEQSE